MKCECQILFLRSVVELAAMARPPDAGLPESLDLVMRSQVAPMHASPGPTPRVLSQRAVGLGGGAAVEACWAKGAPTPVAWCRMRAPRSLMAQIDAAVQQQAVTASSLQPKYGTPIDRESAYEKLTAKLAQAPQPDAGDKPAKQQHPPASEHEDGGGGVIRSSAFKSFARSAATVLGREITRSIFGTRRR